MEDLELFRVTTKAVIFLDDKVLLLRKPTGKWDLPGGRLDAGEEVETCLGREAKEEMGIGINIGPLISCNLRRLKEGKSNVVVVSHLCTLNGGLTDITLSTEHTKAQLFKRDEIDNLDLRATYRKAVQKAFDDQTNGINTPYGFDATDSAQGDNSLFQRLKARWFSS